MTNTTAASFGQPSLYQEPPNVRHSQRPRKINIARNSIGKEYCRLGAAGESEIQQGNEEDVSTHFHISIGWTLGAPTQIVNKDVEDSGDDQLTLDLSVSAVKVKMGNRVHAVTLSLRRQASNGIL